MRWSSETDFSIGATSYSCRPRFDIFESGPEGFCIRKPRELVERYEGVLRKLAPRRIVELGIYQGGSTALIAQLARPEKLVALDLEPQPVAALAEFAEREGLAQVISAHWGVDQADGSRVGSIVDEQFGERAIDLIVDDASHMLEPTRRSFETLFPRLRPGGLYLLEDWGWAHREIEVWPGRPPLSVLVAEVTIAAAHRPDIVAGIEVDRQWAMISRGDAELDPGDFALGSALGGRGRRIAAAMEAAGTAGDRSRRGRRGRLRGR